MKLLAYCLLRSSARRPEPLPGGVGGASVEVVEEGGLAAAVSRGEPLFKGAPGLSPLLEYRDVVDAFARAATVLPVRYGAFFDGEEALRALLREEGKRLEELLAEVEDHVEMAVLVAANAVPRSEAPGAPPGQAAEASGHGYLAARRAYYAERDGAQQSAAHLLERFRTAFAGLFTRSAAEVRPLPLPTAGSRGAPRQWVSLSFLVPVERVTEFRERYRGLAAAFDADFALAGPRPPYSFVSLRAAPGGRSVRRSP